MSAAHLIPEVLARHPGDREAAIRELIERHGFSLRDARELVAVELGEARRGPVRI